jgi:hypothetical protein
MRTIITALFILECNIALSNPYKDGYYSSKEGLVGSGDFGIFHIFSLAFVIYFLYVCFKDVFSNKVRFKNVGYCVNKQCHRYLKSQKNLA